MTIRAEIIADSISPEGERLTTLKLRYPRFIHAEAKTHRLLRIGTAEVEMLQEVGFMDDPNLSRNASSSRAIPVERLIQDVIDDPVDPIYWGKNRAGMQAREEINETEKRWAQNGWNAARQNAIRSAKILASYGVHKQTINRIIEPYCHINVVVTATEWDNFFALRLHPDAQPEIQELARQIQKVMVESEPVGLFPGEWHLPFVNEDLCNAPLSVRKRVSAARCARVSYLTHDGRTPSIEEDLDLYDRLALASPPHCSPLEHQATPDVPTKDGWENPHLHANFRGWVQHRKLAGF